MIALVLLLSSFCTALGVHVLPHNTSHAGDVNKNLRLSQAISHVGHSKKIWGHPDCPCVGIANMEGEFRTEVDGKAMTYPAEAGATCDAWDETAHHACTVSDPPDWCFNRWCYVDPCNCNIKEVPSKSKVGITFQGQPAFWSSATCGDTDTYSASMSKEACINQKNAADCAKAPDCTWHMESNCTSKEFLELCKLPDPLQPWLNTKKEVDSAKWGQESCRCIGLAGREGYTKIERAGKQIKYPLDVGAYCAAWESDVEECSPDRKGDLPPWCKRRWCYVDPCKCKAARTADSDDSPGQQKHYVPPKASTQVGLLHQGKHLYFSYETCGDLDSWTKAHQEDYCVEQPTPKACKSLGDRCVFKDYQCLGKHLATECGRAFALGGSARLILFLAGFVLLSMP